MPFKLPALPYVRAGVSEGLSANEAFRRYQAAAEATSSEIGERATASNRSMFLQQYSAIRHSRGDIPEAMSAPKDVAFGGLTPTPRESFFPGAYNYAAVAFTQTPGSIDVDRGIFMVRSREALTPAEIEAETLRMIEESQVERHGTFFGQNVLGVAFTGVQNLVPISEGNR